MSCRVFGTSPGALGTRGSCRPGFINHFMAEREAAIAGGEKGSFCEGATDFIAF